MITVPLKSGGLMLSIEQLKIYLGIDGGEQDTLLSGFLKSARHIIEKVLRKDIASMESRPEIINTAIQYICWQMYFHRNAGDFNMKEIEKTVALMLSDLREAGF